MTRRAILVLAGMAAAQATFAQTAPQPRLGGLHSP